MYVKPLHKHFFKSKSKRKDKQLFVDVSEVQQVFFYVCMVL